MAKSYETARIKVVGVGGCGCNAVARMVKENVRGAEFVIVNTDAQALTYWDAPLKVRIGDRLTRGQGAGGDPNVGRRAAEESRDELADVVGGADIVFVTAGMGGGTGTGAAPVVADLARQAKALTVAVVTMPFSFEGVRRRLQAEAGIGWLKDRTDTLIVVPNDALLKVCDHRVTLEEAFRVADGTLLQGIQAIAEVITVPGEINLDLADIRTILSDAGPSLMCIGTGLGHNRAIDAAKNAIANPLLDMSIAGATGVLFNISGGDLSLFEVGEAARIISRAVAPNANIIFGLVNDPKMADEARITLIATGFHKAQAAAKAESPPAEKASVAEPAPEPAPAGRPLPRRDGRWSSVLSLFKE